MRPRCGTIRCRNKHNIKYLYLLAYIYVCLYGEFTQWSFLSLSVFSLILDDDDDGPAIDEWIKNCLEEKKIIEHTELMIRTACTYSDNHRHVFLRILFENYWSAIIVIIIIIIDQHKLNARVYYVTRARY